MGFVTKREAFRREADAAYERRRREAWNALREGDRITADINGARVVVTVMGRLSPDLLVRTADGEERLINRYCFGARLI